MVRDKYDLTVLTQNSTIEECTYHIFRALAAFNHKIRFKLRSILYLILLACT